MNTSVKRVSKERFEREIEDNMVAGWALKSQNDHVAIMEKSGGFGKLGIHIIIAIFTIWWTIGMGNIAYMLYSYLANGKELHIKVSEETAPISAAIIE